jgi:hypothetical protein
VEIYENLSLENLDGEIWKMIDKYKDYQVSNFGRVKSFKKYHGTDERILKQSICRKYFIITLSKNKIRKNKYIHRLVYETFKEKIEKGYDVHHINENKEDNFVENLESTLKFDHQSFHNKGEKSSWFGKHHSEKTKQLMSVNAKQKGENNSYSKLTNKEVIQIKMLFKLNFKNKEISRIYHIAQNTVSSIRTEKRWSHIKV